MRCDCALLAGLLGPGGTAGEGQARYELRRHCAGPRQPHRVPVRGQALLF